MKKIISLFFVLSLLSSLCVAFAAETSDAVIERVDIPLSEAMNHPSFSVEEHEKSEVENMLPETRSVSWECWGEKGWDSYTGLYYPIGYSRHVKDGVTLSTYHYTRTFLGSTIDPRGDSGYQWGSYTVKATGTVCYNDVWALYVHKVYYGTTTG